MRLRIDFKTEKNAKIPVNYQGAIAEQIKMAVEDVGVEFYTFSRLIAYKRKIEGKWMRIEDGVASLFVSSPTKDVLDSIELFFRRNPLLVRNTVFKAVVFKRITPTYGSNFISISPITVHYDSNGYRVYPYPDEGTFWQLVIKEAVRKYRELYDVDVMDAGRVRLNIQSFRKKLLEFDYPVCPVGERVGKFRKVKAFEIAFSIEAPDWLVKFCYDAGFGMNTEFGFGMVKTYRVKG